MKTLKLFRKMLQKQPIYTIMQMYLRDRDKVLLPNKDIAKQNAAGFGNAPDFIETCKSLIVIVS